MNKLHSRARLIILGWSVLKNKTKNSNAQIRQEDAARMKYSAIETFSSELSTPEKIMY